MARSVTLPERDPMSAVIDFPAKPEVRPYLDAFRRRPGEPEWLAGVRERGLARFAETGFPSRRGEDWRYIDLRPLADRPMLPADAGGEMDDGAQAKLAEIGLAGATARLVFVDGRYDAALSATTDLPDGLRFYPMAEAIAARPDLVRALLEDGAGEPFAALNAAFFADGFVVEAAPGVRCDRPIEVVHLASGKHRGSVHTRSLVVLGDGSCVSLVESFAGAGDYWRNDVAALRLGTAAELTHVRLVTEADAAVHLDAVAARLAERAHLDMFVLLLGGRTVRHEVTITGEGEDARCDLNGAFIVSDRQEANIVTTIDHRAPGGQSRELIKGVAAGRAHGAFQGRIIVRPGAQKTDAQQLSRNLIVGRRAAIDAKPELEIDADDVKCSHGAAIGDLDENALFYLRARGIPEQEARRMLIDAFIRDAVALVAAPDVREHLLAQIGRRLVVLEE
jgi:Fe-S cluster assembly protein SufD